MVAFNIGGEKPCTPLSGVPTLYPLAQKTQGQSSYRTPLGNYHPRLYRPSLLRVKIVLQPRAGDIMAKVDPTEKFQRLVGIIAKHADRELEIVRAALCCSILTFANCYVAFHLHLTHRDRAIVGWTFFGASVLMLLAIFVFSLVMHSLRIIQPDSTLN